MNKLTGVEKKIVKKQNDIITDFIISKYQEIPFEISRDNSDRAIILVGSTSQTEILAKMLGTNNRNKPIFINVGKLTYHLIDDKSMNIDSIVVLKNFRNQGVGKIMLQATENFAVDSGIKNITANVLTNESYISEPDGTIALGKNLLPVLFDPNIYLFLTNNYVKVADDGKNISKTVKVKNNKPKKNNIHFGVSPKLKKDKSDERFKPSKILRGLDKQQFSHFIPNNSNVARFEPLFLHANEISLNNLLKIVGESSPNEIQK